MKDRYLVSWLGDADLRGLQQGGGVPGMSGPLCTVLEHYGAGYFSKVWVLHTDNRATEAKEAQQRLATFAPCVLHSFSDVDPTHPEHVHKAMLSVLKKLPASCA